MKQLNSFVIILALSCAVVMTSCNKQEAPNQTTTPEEPGTGEVEEIELALTALNDNGHSGEQLTINSNQNVTFTLLPIEDDDFTRQLTRIEVVDSMACNVVLGYIANDDYYFTDDVISIEATTSKGQKDTITVTGFYWKPGIYQYKEDLVLDSNSSFYPNKFYSLEVPTNIWGVGNTIAVAVEYSKDGILYGIDKHGFKIEPVVEDAYSPSTDESTSPVLKLYEVLEGANDYAFNVTLGKLTQKIAPASNPVL